MALEAEHGTVPPPWAMWDDDPFDIRWRMGDGEGHLFVWHEWWNEKNLPVESRIAYFQQWPAPECWVYFVIEAIWEVDLLDFEVDDGIDYYERVEELGLRRTDGSP